MNRPPGKVWDEITYPFLNFNGAAGLKLIHDSKGVHWRHIYLSWNVIALCSIGELSPIQHPAYTNFK